MRHISFALTTPQFMDGTKDVTRRMGWERLEGGEVLRAVKKAMGLKKGEKMEPLALMQVISARQERLDRMTFDPVYGLEECRREGFPDMEPGEFVDFFCRSHTGCFPKRVVTRIEFRKLPLIRQTFALHMRSNHGSTYGYNLIAPDDTTIIGARSVFTPKAKYREKHPAREIFTLHGVGEFDSAAALLVAYQKQLDQEAANARSS